LHWSDPREHEPSTRLDVQLEELLRNRRTAIVNRWTDLALRVYPQDSTGFIRHEKDRFRNPVGHLTRESLDALITGLLAGRSVEEMKQPLDRIVRIRAVQDLSPSQAVGFVCLLKRAVREELGEAPEREMDLSAVDAWIDGLVLQAFDLFVECRQRIYELRVREIKCRASTLLERMKERSEESPADCRPVQPVKGGCGV
jgi:hypothetical protein